MPGALPPRRLIDDSGISNETTSPTTGVGSPGMAFIEARMLVYPASYRLRLFTMKQFAGLRTMDVRTTAMVVMVASASLLGQNVSSRVDRLIGAMTLEEKIAMLHGASDPQSLGQAGYLPGVPRLGIPPLRLTDGPAGVRATHPATAMPAPVALAATFSRAAAKKYGEVMGQETRALGHDVLLAPMVNIVRVPQGGRNFETLGEDPFLASQIVAAEVSGIESQGAIATIKHFAANNQETQRQSVSADVDERTLQEIELPGFEAAIRAGAGSVMAAYNKVNGTWSAESVPLLTDVLRKQWHFQGFVMSDWGATHSGPPALTAGMDLEMPSGRNYAALGDAVKSGALDQKVIDEAVRRILVQMDRKGLLASAPPARPSLDQAKDDAIAREIAEEGAVLLKNTGNVLPIRDSDWPSVAVIGATARAMLIGGGGSARVAPLRKGVPLDALRQRAPSTANIVYAPGNDLDGAVIPSSVLTPPAAIDFTGPRAIAARSTWNYTGTLTAPTAGTYELKLQTAGGRGTLTIDPPQPAPPGAAAPGGGAGTGRGGRGLGRGGAGGGGLLTTSDGLTNSTRTVQFEAGSTHQIVITATADAATPMQVRLAWSTPEWPAQKIAEAVAAARTARVAIVFAYDEGSEGRDRSSLSLPGNQDAVIAAVARANPRTVVVLTTGDPVLMPWASDVAAILQMWYPGQAGAEAITSVLSGDVNPGGKLPVTFPTRIEDAPTNMPERYPGVDGHGVYSEGIFVGYRWYDDKHIEPLFPFGHGLSYTTFAYSRLSVTRAGGGYDVTFTIRNTGARKGDEVAQIYVGRPPSSPVPMAARALAGFERVTLEPNQSRRVTIRIDARAMSYWSIDRHAWVVAPGAREFAVGSSSRDLRLTSAVSIPRAASHANAGLRR